MPRVTAAHRQARRDQIAEAALRVLDRHGVSEASIALIAGECGLSTGAIYANFENKADLARYIATSRLGWRTERLEQLAASGVTVAPAEVLRLLIDQVLDRQGLPLSVVLQFWSVATVEEDLHAVLTEHLDRLRSVVEVLLRPWAAQFPDASAVARETSQVCLIMCQGFLANRCLSGWLEPDAFVRAASTAFGSIGRS